MSLTNSNNQRQELARLIYQLGSFTESEIIRELVEQIGEDQTINIGEGQGISDYLGEICDLGYLNCRNGTYTLLSR